MRAMVVDREPVLLAAKHADFAAFDEEDLRRADSDVVGRSKRELFSVRGQHGDFYDAAGTSCSVRTNVSSGEIPSGNQTRHTRR
ncbi:MAG: hypothetical protein FD138_3635 [Planctomycetota bacterium]|nr:MAG: hypothetical protein FD138_3635 [Planctomycetota bacterium]